MAPRLTAAGAASLVHGLALAVWVGAVVFFSLAAAPALFAALPRDEAGRAVAAIFPAYYRTGWVAGGVALAALAARARLVGWRAVRLRALLVSAMLLVSLYAGLVVLPRVRAARAAGDVAARDRGHRIAVLLNVLVLGGGVVATALALRDRQAPEH